MLTLYWAPQSRSLRALWLLEESGLDYGRVHIDIRAGAQDTAEYGTINPMRKVPALVDGEAKIFESGAIAAYVADRAAPGLLAPPPGDPARGRYLSWLFFSPGCIESAITQKFTGMSIPSEQAGWGDFDRVFTVLEETLSTGPFLLGERFTAADVMIGTDLRFVVDLWSMVEPRPALRAYIDRCTARPAFARALAIDEAAGGPAASG